MPSFALLSCLCWGPVARVSKAVGYSSTNLDTTQFPPTAKWLGNHVRRARTNPRAGPIPALFLPWLNTIGTPVVTPRSLRYRANDRRAGLLERHGQLMLDKTRRNHWLPRVPDNRHSRANIHPVAA
jgi:hypothetical protein